MTVSIKHGMAAADITNPQSLNRYAYVTNNPTTLIDPSGLYESQCQVFGICPGSGNGSAGGGIGGGGGAPGCGGPAAQLRIASGFAHPDLAPCGSGGGGGGSITTLPLSGANKLFNLLPSAFTQPQNVCQQPVLDAVNQTFGTNLNSADVQLGFPNGGAWNLNIRATSLPASQFNSIQTGRYPLSPLSWLIGYGPTLHITGQTGLDPFPATFQNGNIGGVTSVLFTAHIDSSFAYNPIGALIHLIRDVLHIGGPRDPCP